MSQAFGNKAPPAYIFRHPGKSLPGFPRLAAEYSMGTRSFSNLTNDFTLNKARQDHIHTSHLHVDHRLRDPKQSRSHRGFLCI